MLLLSPFKTIKSKHIFNRTTTHVGRKGLEKLDFLLILIETLEINAVQSILLASKDLGLEDSFSNRVELWKRRSHNPLRRYSRRGKLTPNHVDSLISVVSVSSNKLYPLLRQLLSNREPQVIQEQRWMLLSKRFNDLIKERMNLRRSVIQNILNQENSKVFLQELVLLLALSSGQNGTDRLKNYIYQIR